MRLTNRIAAWVAVGLLAGCGSESGTESFSEVRTVRAPESGIADRSVTNPDAGGTMPVRPTSDSSLEWTTPSGWTEQAPSSMRLANLGIDGEPAVECYVTRLAGAAGGLDANLNRWRTQMSLPPYTAEEIAALPTIQILGMDAVVVEMQGDYKGMSATEGQSGFALLGAVAQSDGASYFIKMTGPADVIERERNNFETFCASLGLGGALVTASAPATSGAPFEWTAPDSWTRAADRAMRVVTYTVNGAECYVTTLRGQAGGAAANLNRWRTQMDQPELSPAELAALVTVTVLGKASPLVEVTGAYAGMDGTRTDDAMLLGIVREDDAESVFIKMIGPKAVVLAERANFVAFCESLK